MKIYEQYINNDISVLPIDGEKRPVGEWKTMQGRILNLAEASVRFRATGVKGLGVICGAVSKGVECLDFDMKYDITNKIYETYAKEVQAERPDLYAKMVITKTRNNGYHWIYRCPQDISPGKRLAQRKATKEELDLDPKDKLRVLIETRGEGQYFVTYPTAGYDLIQGEVFKPALISGEEKQYLHLKAIMFSEHFEVTGVVSDKPKGELDSNDPLYDFNQRGDIIPTLVEAGWTVVDETSKFTTLKRPGQTSAKHSAYLFKDRKIFYVHSTSTEFNAGEGYTQSHVFAKLKHDGNFSRARKALADLGFGDLSKMRVDIDLLKECLERGDFGDADLLRRILGDRFRYNISDTHWYQYLNGCWVADKGETYKGIFAEELLTQYQHLESHLEADMTRYGLKPVKDEDPSVTTGREKLKQLLNQVRSRKTYIGKNRGIDEISKAFRSFAGISIEETHFNKDPHQINFSNGVYNAKTGELTPHDSSYLLSKQIAFNVEPAATCPKWEEFMHTIFAGQKELIEFVQTSMGYALTGLTSEQYLWFAYGKGANGKSTFFSTIQMLLGSYTLTTPIEVLLKTKGGTTTDYNMALWPGRRFIVSTELPEFSRLNESSVKDMTGGERIPARQIFGRPFEFTPTHKLWMFGNHKPRISGTDKGIWRRINLVPFKVTIPKEDRRPMNEIQDEFMAEASGIINWMLKGLARYMKTRRLVAPKLVLEENEKYQEESDPLNDFIETEIVSSPGNKLYTDELFDHYTRWTIRTGEFKNIPSSRKLADSFEERGYSGGRGTGNKRCLLDIAIAPPV